MKDRRHPPIAFPTEFETPFSMGFRALFQSLDARIDLGEHQAQSDALTFVIYGGTAVGLWLADRPEIDLTPTRDIDLVGSRALARNGGIIEQTKALIDAHFGELFPHSIQYNGPNKFALGPDYECNVVDISSRLALMRLRVEVLHPFDLIVAKMTRNHDKDFEDITCLLEHLIVSRNLTDALKTYVYTAYPFLDEASKRKFEWAYYDVFEEDFDHLPVDDSPYNV